MSKRIIIIVVIGVALVLAGGGWWFFNNMKVPSIKLQIQRVGEIQQINIIKDLAVTNVHDFLSTAADPASIWIDLLKNKQFLQLKEVPINIILDDIGNPDPFKPQGNAAKQSTKTQ